MVTCWCGSKMDVRWAYKMCVTYLLVILVTACVCGYNKEHKEHSNRICNEAKATKSKEE
jgi:uncharacterized membrane protein YhdT